MALASTAPTRAGVTDASQKYGRALALVTTLFFMWGFLTALNDILVPHLKAIFDLTYTEVMLIQFSFFSAYFVFSLPSGKIVEWIGYKRTMVAGLLTMGLGALLFIPAASVPSYPLFLGALIILAGGMTMLQVSANPYVAVLGPPRTASSRLNLTQAFNSLGTTIAPYLGSLFILTGTTVAVEKLRAFSPAELHAYRVHEAASIKGPYILFALTLALLAIVIAWSRLPVIPAVEGGRKRNGSASKDSPWAHRNLVLGAIGIFTYVGAEVAIGSFLVNYFGEPRIGNLSAQTAARYVSLYWGAAMVGRFIGSAVLQKIRTSKVLGFAAVMAFLLVSVSMLSSGRLAMRSIICVGLFNSIMFPSIFTLGIDGLGHLTGEGSGVLIAAIVGGAIIPELQGVLADRVGVQYAFIIPILCYLYIAYFARVVRERNHAEE